MMPDTAMCPGGTEAAPVETSSETGKRKDTPLQPCSCKTSPPPKGHKICPSRHGDETVSTCSITPSDPLCHRSSAAQRRYL